MERPVGRLALHPDSSERGELQPGETISIFVQPFQGGQGHKWSNATGDASLQSAIDGLLELVRP